VQSADNGFVFTEGNEGNEGRMPEDGQFDRSLKLFNQSSRRTQRSPSPIDFNTVGSGLAGDAVPPLRSPADHCRGVARRRRDSAEEVGAKHPNRQAGTPVATRIPTRRRLDAPWRSRDYASGGARPNLTGVPTSAGTEITQPSQKTALNTSGFTLYLSR